VAVADEGLIENYNKTVIMHVPDPSPIIPWIKPPIKPPKDIHKNALLLLRFIYC
jgi:hypothetical protein